LTQAYAPRPAKSRVILGLVIACLMAALSPYLTLLSTVVLIVPVLLAFLYAFSGIVPVIAGSSLTLGAFALVFDFTGMWMALVAFIAPAALIVRNLRLRLPFFRQLAIAVISLMAGVVAALAIAYLALGTDIISALTPYLRAALESVEYPGVVDYLLASAYTIPGAPAAYTPELLMTGFLAEAQRASYLDAFIGSMHASLALTLPGHLLRASALAGVLAVVWPGYLIEKKAPPAQGAFVPPGEWHAPYHLILGLLGTLGVSYILHWQNISGGDTAYMTMRALILLLFRVQAAASIERRLKAAGAKTWTRALIIVITQLIFGDIAVFYGAASAMFGSKGAIKQLASRRNGKQ
jgi:hypothetical protein